MNLNSSEISALAAVVAAGFAAFSWNESRKANASTGKIAAIEIERRKQELAPNFIFTDNQIGDGVYKIAFQLIGPPALNAVDDIVLTIRDNELFSLDQYTEINQREMNTTIWGPFRFSPDVSNNSLDGRHSTFGNLHVGDRFSVQIQRSSPPSWITEQAWRERYFDLEFNFSVIAKNSSYGEWEIPYSLHISDPRITFLG